MTKTEILKRIRAKCLDCCCGSAYEVTRCHIERCPLHALRFGKNPDKRELPPEKREELIRRMKNVRQTPQKKSILTAGRSENSNKSQKNNLNE